MSHDTYNSEADLNAHAPGTLPQRKNIRAEFHDYSGGEYFVTICTRNKEHYFGQIYNGHMFLTPIGLYCHRQIEELPLHYENIEVPLFVVMPNHIHAIICIRERTECDIHARNVGLLGLSSRPDVSAIRSKLSVILGGFKRAVTMFARLNGIDFEWQKRYHDHIIRGTWDGNKIAEYIENNVARWDSDCYCE